ncbi:CpaD family pilus assembly protein [Sphingomonas sp.]|uniref:CpaD family pilus assembly protein n=1 Tax=Sphingomonas sp. TaxID=28214 RepID=UPI003CC675DC
MKRSLLLPLFIPALSLGACAGTTNRGLESVHQAVVSRQDFVLDLQAGGDGLAGGERGRLDGWLSSMRLGYGDKVTIDDPVGRGGVRTDVAQTVAAYGLLLSEERPVTGAPVAPGTIRVVVSRAHAAVPGCPDWSRDSSVDFNQNTSSNFGCGVNASLAAMIAQPEDLVHGSGPGAVDARSSAKAIDAYRRAAPSGAGGATVQSPGTGGH